MALNSSQKTTLGRLKKKTLSIAEGIAQNTIICKESQLKPASVIIPLIPAKIDYDVLLTLRSEDLRHHAGQISFPGGKMEISDENLLFTALRETYEEIGLKENQLEIISSMRPFESIAGFLVTPFIALVTPNYDIKIDPREVESTFSVPLNYLLDPFNTKTQTIIRNDRPMEIFLIQYQNYQIWGLTAKILVEMRNLLA